MKSIFPAEEAARRMTSTQELIEHPDAFGLDRHFSTKSADDATDVVCGFCSTGCSLKIHLKNGHAVGLTPNPQYPVNLGMACPKGWEALTPLHATDRATTPLLRNADGDLEPVDWDTAMQVFALRFKAIQDKNGPESVAWLGTGQIVTEELAFLGSLAKFGMGIIHGDGNTRQCMASAVSAYKESFGFDAPPYTYKDFEKSDVLVFVGSNVCIAHPILWQRVLQNKNAPKIIVIDPRRTETAMAATHHYALQPKSDLFLFYGLARILIEKGAINSDYIEKHTKSFHEFKEFLYQPVSVDLSRISGKTETRSTPISTDRGYTPELVSVVTGISTAQLNELAEIIKSGQRVSFWWTMGVNQSHEGTRVAQSIINLALLTGNIGRPGTGANSITGQCNAMGSRLFSNTTNLLGGHDFLNPGHRAKVANILQIDPALIPQKNSWAYDQIIDGIANDRIKGLWIIATNSSHSWIHQSDFNKILQKLDFLVVQDMYHTTETAQRAHLVLPAAAWGEKDGTFINSERRFGLVKKVSKAPGQALSDFKIFKLVAHYWGCAHLFRHWTSPEAVFQILKELSKGQPCDFSGIKDYRMLDDLGGIQWPLPEGTFPSHKERRLFEDGAFFHADRKARFVFEPPRDLPESTCEKFPFTLLTGRGSSAQWHTQTRTAKSDVLRRLYPETVYVEINPEDAERLRISSHDVVEVSSRRGRIEARAFVTYTVQRKQLFIPMHYQKVNELTFPSVDPYSRQPSYKSCAVSVARIRRP